MQDNPGRKGDGVLIVLQNNATRRLNIQTANETAANLLGYAEGELEGRALETVLGQKLGQLLAEDLEFSDDAPDFGEILARQRDIKLRNRLGQELAAPCSVSRLMAQGQQACFQLVLPNEREVRAQQQLKDFLKLNLEGRMKVEDATGLPDRGTGGTYLSLLKNYIANNGMEAAFAVIRLDRHEKSLARYGKDACVELIQHAANCCRTTFRSEDVVFALNDHMLGLVLMDISRESARLVLNRLRWNIRNHRILFGGKSEFSVTVSICFDMLDADRGDSVLPRCEESAAALDKDARNSLVELGQ
jgi:GGDEF domain-containing protein